MGRAWRVSASLAAVGLCVGAACATEEQVGFGDPARVSGGVGTSSSGGPACTPNPDCAVSFADDVLHDVLLARGGCASAGCHDVSRGGFELSGGDAAAAHGSLLGYTHPIFGKYVAPCDPSASAILCNLLVEEGVESDNPLGDCGSKMPKVSAPDSPVKQPLGQEDIDIITEWIACGAQLD